MMSINEQHRKNTHPSDELSTQKTLFGNNTNMTFKDLQMLIKSDSIKRLSNEDKRVRKRLKKGGQHDYRNQPNP